MSREMYMRRALVKEFPDTPFIFDKVIEDGCSRRRPDVFMELLTHVVVIECDETQHRGYTCDNKRMMQLFVDVAMRPTVFIRFNPDSYTSGGTRVKGCFREDIVKGEKVLTPLPSWEVRVQELLRAFKIAKDTIPTREITEIKLFFNN